MSRNLLAKHKLPDFVQFLRHSNIQYRDGRGDYDVLQVLTPKASWQCIFERHKSTVHYTVAQPLEGIVRQFIAASKTPAKSTPPDTGNESASPDAPR